MKLATRKSLFLGAVVSLTMCTTASYAVVPVNDSPSISAVTPDDEYTVKGVVTDDLNEPLMGVNIIIKGTSTGCTTNLDGEYSLKIPAGKAELVFSYIGFQSQTHVVTGARVLNVVMKDDSKMLESVVVTAMGIVRKSTSLTYATQQVKAEELMKVEDPNLVNSLDGKIAGVTITQGAGGAGGASKILLRGNKSISGNNAPLIVVDGIPMSNSTRDQKGSASFTNGTSEGGDPLSQINPDDIESINVLKGANAAALYGSQAANGVVMITTKKGKEGRLDVSFNTNVTFDTPFVTPDIQNVYGIDVDGNIGLGRMLNGQGSWGAKLSSLTGTPRGTYVDYLDIAPSDGGYINSPFGSTDVYTDANGKQWSLADSRPVYMRNYGKDDVADFFRTGVTTNNSVSLSGGTEKVKSYFSYANSHANGMIENNTYNRNTFALRQHYTLWERLKVDVSANYVNTRTLNRVGGGLAQNPIYDLYLMPRNVDFDYYRDNYAVYGTWTAPKMELMSSSGRKNMYTPVLESSENDPFNRGPQVQNWFFNTNGRNNPYYLRNHNTGVSKDDRFYGNVQANLDIWDGLSAQARVSIDHTKYSSESTTGATTFYDAGMYNYGKYWLSNSSQSEIYTDYMLMYNKTFKEDFSVNASVGYVGHVTKGESTSTYNFEAYQIGSTGQYGAIIQGPGKYDYNVFLPSAGDRGNTSRSHSSNWDQAALATASFGWKDAVYVDGSYRMDWYRAFKQARFASGDNAADDHYGYWGVGANFIPTNLWELPEPLTYLKYRISYSEVGNSIPNSVFDLMTINLVDGTSTPSNYNSFTPRPETMKSFETGIETAFFNNALNVDVTYYNTTLDGAYLVVGWTNGRRQPVNTTAIRNQGMEFTVAYDWMFAKNWRWKTSVNFSFNLNKILDVYTDTEGNEKDFDGPSNQGIKVKYIKGKEYGDMYATDYNRWGQDCTDANGKFHKAGDIYLTSSGKPSFDGRIVTLDENGVEQMTESNQYGLYVGNMNSKYQLSWSNTFSYKNFNLYFLISGRIGGKVVSTTEAYLDYYGVSQRTANLRLAAEENGIYTSDGKLGMYINDGRDVVGIQDWMTNSFTTPFGYIYDATNFRLRELSLGYTFRDLFGENKNLSLSFIARNLFFLYKDAPFDTDVSIGTGNSMQAFECFNMPSSRSFGLNLKVNF